MASPRKSFPLTLAVALAFVGLLSACTPVDSTEVRVRDARAVGVVADRTNEWLMPPYSPRESVEVYRNFATKETLTRSASGSIDYESEHWALGKRVDTTALVDEKGRFGWTGSPSSTAALERALQRGGEVRLHSIQYVHETGPFGLCNGTLFDSCIANPAVHISLAANSRDVEEVEVVRTPLRGFGV